MISHLLVLLVGVIGGLAIGEYATESDSFVAALIRDAIRFVRSKFRKARR